MEDLPWEIWAAFRHFQTICVVFQPLNSSIARSPMCICCGNPMPTFKCKRVYVRLPYKWSILARLCVCVCSFLVSGCEICGFSQSGLIFVFLSLSQQIVVKYLLTLKQRERDTEFTFNYSLTSQGQISGDFLQHKQNNTAVVILAWGRPRFDHTYLFVGFSFICHPKFRVLG